MLWEASSGAMCDVLTGYVGVKYYTLQRVFFFFLHMHSCVIKYSLSTQGELTIVTFVRMTTEKLSML